VDRALINERCVPCERGTPPLSAESAGGLLAELDSRWQLSDDGRALVREITFKNFGRAMGFLQRLAQIAESEGHHPDFCLSGWNHVRLELTTHAIDGLSHNDFVLAAKLEAAIKAPTET
jgi:4a-hydroxytetrahydrobiopterin dehydratase